jgi:hypothetical protein
LSAVGALSNAPRSRRCSNVDLTTATPASSRRGTFVQHRTEWEPPPVRAVRAVWTFGGGRCYSLAPASVELLLVHPLSSNRDGVLVRNRPVSVRRRLSTPWTLTLRAPSFHVGAGRAFTRCFPTSDAPLSSPGTDGRLLFRPPAPPPCAALERMRFGFTERPESFHRLLGWRSHLLCSEKMEERLEAPSVVSDSPPASAALSGLSAT